MVRHRKEDPNLPLFPISVVAHILEVHPQTLRLYEREGLISPCRTKGKTRLYSQRDLEQLKTILHFTQDLGINLAGVGLLLELQERINALEEEMQQALEVWGKDPEEEIGGEAESQGPPQSSPPKKIKIKIEEG